MDLIFNYPHLILHFFFKRFITDFHLILVLDVNMLQHQNIC